MEGIRRAQAAFADADAADVMGVSSEDDAQALVNELRYRKVKVFLKHIVHAARHNIGLFWRLLHYSRRHQDEPASSLLCIWI